MAGLTANLQQIDRSYSCSGPHRFFVAHTGQIDNLIHVIALCTDCGEAIIRTFQVAPEETK